MLFNSVAFLLFFPIVCMLYFAIPAKWLQARNILLLAASYYFYMNWDPAYALLLFTSTMVTYLSALGIERSRGQWHKLAFLVGSLIANLGILFLFKYYNFVALVLQGALDAAGVAMHVPHFALLLPVGISFYTFQALGYSIDAYRGTTSAERDFVTYALFVSFFPQLVAGPIERSQHLLPQFRERHAFSYDDAMAGLRMIVWGYFMKLVVADRCGIYVDAIFNNLPHHNGGSYLVASLLFPFQIYGDFAGYSLIAIGTARVMGFRLMQNFRQPYFASSIGEFWHRWHISLSTWFKDYVYIPLGGSRVGEWRHYRNLLVTFAVSGIWHGAGWTFLCWGTLHGVLLCVEKALKVDSRAHHGLRRIGHCLLTFVLVSIALVIFRAANLSDAVTVLLGIVTSFGTPFVRLSDLGVIALALLMLFVHDLKQEVKCRRKWLQPVTIALLIAYITLFGIFDSSQFIYFQF